MSLRRLTAITAAVAGLHAAVLAVVMMPGTPGVDPQTTGAIPMTQDDAQPAVPVLEAALDALDGGDYDAVRRLRQTMEAGSLDARILLWAMARSGLGAITSGEILQAIDTLKDWPDRTRIRSNYEEALAREDLAPAALVKAYEAKAPSTLSGAISLARAWHFLGDDAKARDALAPWWRNEPIGSTQEMRILAEFGGILTQEDHRQRFLAMMYRDRIRSAERVADLAGMSDVLAPWSAAIREQKDAGKLLDAASDAFKKTPHYLFARITWLRRLERDGEAAKLLLESPVDAAELVDPDEWWVERRIVSRDAFEHGDADTAYRIAAMQRGGSTETQLEAAFHAGWYALRGLKDPQKAAAHFEKIEALASGAISRARGAYWLGRAHEAAGLKEEADKDYARAAEYNSTYYGLLARQRLGLATEPPRRPSVTTSDAARFRDNEAIAAMHRLEAIGQTDRAKQIALGLGWSLDDAPEIAQLVAHWESRDERYVALRIAKAADWRGVETGALTHPIGAIPASAQIDPSERPLAYAVARQESEFNVGARSRANALGLMQLLPGTARQVAKTSGLKYEPARLASDGGYNATLGTAYLNTQLDRFDGSYILTFIAYNAGPSRVGEWLKRFGDPRGKPLDEVVDWVEQIPFTETRNYVQRVMENLEVYKARLDMPVDFAHDLRFGAAN